MVDMLRRALMVFVAGAALGVGLAASTSAASLGPPGSNMTTTISRTDFGIDVFSYDSQLNAPSTIPSLTSLGLGMQQFPNANEWSWTTNSFRSGGTAPVSLLDWGHVLQATGNQGLFIFDYDENPAFTGGGSPADARQLTQYIVSHRLPISAIVIGSEEYGAWDRYANLNPSFSAAYYAQRAAQIAQAIHSVDPSMKVGVSFALSPDPQSLAWDQMVLRTDGPYINFVSIHDYPNPTELSDSALLSVLPREIEEAMRFVRREVAVNVTPSEASRIQTWVTEYNPYGEPGVQSTEPIYGAAMVESAMLWRAYGASRLFIWSYDGQAHVASSQWPVATNANAPFGLFALAGDGESPELSMNALYPSGLALSQFMAAIGSGGTLTVAVTPTAVIGQVFSNLGLHTFAINLTSVAQTVGHGSHVLVIPGTSLQTSTAALFPRSTARGSRGEADTVQTTLGPAPVPIPVFQPQVQGYPGQAITLAGSGFGAQGQNSHVIISENGINYGGPGDANTVDITNWMPSAISFVVPSGSSGPALTPGSATLVVETADQVVSQTTPLTVTAVPVLPAVLDPSVVSPGMLVTVSGAGFGTPQGGGYVLISQNGVNYGGPGDWYGVTIDQWTNDAVTFEAPVAGMSSTGHGEPSLQPGPATVTVVSSSGLKSLPMAFRVQ